MKKNNYIAILDNAIVEFLPQKTQYEVLRSFLNNKNQSLSLYITEDENTYLNGSQLIKKIDEKPKVKGFIFFSLLQISFKKNQNIEIINKILKNGYEIIFYKEDYLIKNLLQLKNDTKKLKLFRETNLKKIDRLKSLIFF